MDIKDFQRLVLKKAVEAGFEDCEIYYQSGESFQAVVNNGEVAHYETSFSSGAAFRGITGGKLGIAYTERLDEAAADFLVKAASDNAKIAEEGEKCLLYSGGVYEDIKLYNRELDNVKTSEKVKKILEAEAEALNCKNIRSSDRCMYGDDRSKVSIMNTKGLDCAYEANSLAAYISVIAERDGDIKTGWEFFAGNDFDNLEPKKLGAMAARDAVAMLGAKSVKSGVYSVIFKNTAMASILGAFSGAFTAEQVFKGLSMLEGKEDSIIASKAVTIRDDGLLEGGFASAAFDGEGVPCQNKTVVENGVLKTLLYDLKYADKMGKNSTGNGFRAGFKSPVVCDCTNFYICPSAMTESEILLQAENGIYITSVEGLHAGANPVSGDFSLSAEGFLIENGKKTTPIEQITVASNFFRLLENIKSVGDDLRFNMSGIGSPAVLVEKVSVSGL
ncbi:metalloprotease TldD [Clostridiales bacterium]|nr:metalloprotease TldD [Clostridiales bacterium]